MKKLVMKNGMKKSSIITLSIIGGLLLLGILAYFLLPSLIIVPPQKVAVIVPPVDIPAEVITPKIPQVIFIGVTTIPIDLSKSQNILSNIIITFSEAMNPDTVNQNTFLLKGPDNLVLDGVITSDSTKKVWTFNPRSHLKFNSLYHVTVTTKAKGVSGNALVKNFLWSFTTGAGSSSGGSSGGSSSSVPSIPPVLTTITLSPTFAILTAGATQQLTPTKLDQFSEPIDATITYNTSNASVATINASGFVTALEIGNTTITATSGVIGAAAVITVTAPACPAVAVNLGTAGNFTILSKTQITTTGTTSILGNIGVSPVAASFIQGFGLELDSTECFSTSSLVTGSVYAADYNTLGCTTPAMMTTAISDLENAYNTGNGLASCDTELNAGNLGGLTIPAGVHKFSNNVIIPTDVYLSGSATDVWVFQIAGTFDISSATTVHLIGGALAKNVYWLVAGTSTLETTSTFNGNIISGPGTAGIILQNGAILNGRALGQKEVTLIANTVTKPSA